MTNAQVKEGLDAIAREVATVPGISLADVSRIQSHVNTISAKLDWTNGMDTSTLPGQVRRVNPVPSRGGKGSGLSGLGGLGGLGGGLLLSLIHISEPTRHFKRSRMPSSA